MSTTRRDLGWKRVMREMRKFERNPHIKVGVLASSGMHNSSEGKMTVVEVAIQNEFGNDRIPERAFMRNSARDMEKSIEALATNLVLKVEKGAMTVERCMDALGLAAVAAIRKTITDGVPPPNAPSTIARKGSSTPLVDTSQLHQSINYEKVI